MKIGLVVPGFSANSDDWCIPVLVDAVKQLSEHGDVHVFPLRYPYRRDTYRVHGAEVHPVAGGTVRGLGRSLIIGGAMKKIVAEHQKRPFDVLHGIWADEPGFVATLASGLLGVPALVSVMGGELVGLESITYGGQLSRPNRILSATALKKAGRVTAASDEAVHAARRITGAMRAKHVVRQVWGIDPDVFDAGHDPGPLAGRFRLLSVGSLVPVKDHRTVLRALYRLRAVCPGIQLHVVGDGPERLSLSGQASALGIADRVSFHGHVRRDDMGEYYRRADLLVVSSIHEMQPAVLLEAALCSLPAISTRVGMAPDFSPLACDPVTPGDDQQMATAIQRAYSALVRSERRTEANGSNGMAQEAVRATKRFSQLGRASRSLVQSRYLARHTACGLLQLYGEVVGESRQPKRPFQIADASSPAARRESSVLTDIGPVV